MVPHSLRMLMSTTEDVHPVFSEIIKQDSVKAFFAAGVDQLVEDEMHRLAESQNCT